MMNIFTLLTLLFMPISSLKKATPKLCIDCKCFITDNRIGKLGKCSLFPIERQKELYDLVTGVDDQYMYCYATRDNEDMCGKEGKLFKKKYKKRAI